MGVGGDVVVAAAEVLHEGVTGGESPRGAVAFQSAHRPLPGLEPPVVRLDRVVRVLLNDVQRRGDQLIEHPRIHGRAIGRDLDRDRAGAQRPDVDPEKLIASGWDGARALVRDYVAAGLTKFVIRPGWTPVDPDQFTADFVREMVPLQT